ncbi:MAG: tetratricopeptide repeat protein [Parachlamydiales bacterium]|nr:tetratricopeptide repeat protein [Parachlamydiales bacterium]
MNFFRKKNILVIMLLFTCFLQAEESHFKPQAEEEALFLRRIAEFWQDAEYDIAKHQIENYLKDFPQSSLSDSLNAILGNLYMNEKNYTLAVAAYDNIKSSEVKDKVAINFLGSLFHLKWYDRLTEECETYIEKTSDELAGKIKYLQALTYYNQAMDEKDDIEKHKQTISIAKEKFEKLLESKFEIEAREYLSQIHSNLDDFENAAKHYLDLAEKNPHKKDEYLFQAALLQAHYNKELAIDTFSIITDFSSSKTPDAAYNKVLLLFELKKYEDLILQKEKLLSLIDQDQMDSANFFIGRTYFNIEDFENAKSYLEKSISTNEKDPVQMKLALVMLMQSSFNLNDDESFEKSFKLFTSKYPNDENLFESYFAKALLNKKNSKLEEAKKDFENISSNFQNTSQNDMYLYEYAHLLYQLNDFESSKTKFYEFVNRFDNHKYTKNSLTYLINCSIKSIKKSKLDTEKNIFRKNLVNDIEYLFKKEYHFTQKEKFQYRYLLAKTQYDLKEYQLSLDILNTLIEDNPEEAVLSENEKFLSKKEFAQINILMGFCHKNLNSDYASFISFAEKGLKINSAIENAFTTYINLFNSYLILSKQNDQVDNQKLCMAADYLYKAYEVKPNEITSNNLLWLSEFYSSKIKNFVEKDYKNSFANDSNMYLYLKNSINIFENLSKASKSDENLLKLAFLYRCDNNLVKAQEILEGIVKEVRFSPEVEKNKLEEIIFELANTYDLLNEKDKSISIYEEFLPTFKKETLTYSQALLHFARLKLSNISKDQYSIENGELEKIISNFKTISLQKIFENEPTHIEAALDYVDVLCYMEKEKRFEKRQFLLGRLKENFYSEEDIISQDYQHMRNLLIEKQLIFNAYMTAIEADKYICMGYLENNIAHIKVANEFINKLVNDKLVTTKYLNDYISNMKKLIEEFKFE